MLRSLLALLAVLVTGLAFLFERPWLYVAAGLVVVGGLGLLGWWLWTTFNGEDPERPRPAPDPQDSEPDLEEMGIVDIKPEGAAEDEDTEAPATTTASEGNASDQQRGTPASSAVSPTPASDATSSAQASDSSAPPSDEADPNEHPVLTPLLESLRAAIEARTVCLLVQEDVALTYRIEALASTHPSVQSTGTLDTQTPLLTATMSRESVTVRSLAEEKIAIEDLRYYDDPPAVDHLAAAPVSRPDTSSTMFLLADAPADADLGAADARTLLTHFAETVALLLSSSQSAAPVPGSEPSKEHANGQHAGTDATTDDLSATSARDDASPRPRREIIAEEMEAAQASGDDLALALVHLNRAESIARRGDEAVASAERLFHARLDELASTQRIERFGELTYGIFFREDPDAVERRVADLETAMAREDGKLEGGVSVGVAVWGDRDDDPEDLRAEATEALREAYETGTPTIVT